jgi:hypothetical protein
MVEAYLNRGLFKNITKTWSKKYKIKLRVEASTSSALLEYHIFDRDGEEVNL